MQNFSLLKSILGEPWAIGEFAIDIYAPLIASLFDKNIKFEKGEPILPECRSIGGSSEKSNQNKSANINVVKIKSALTKDDQFCGPAGMQTMQEWLVNADNDPNIDGHFIIFDTPGGTVVGTNEFANTIKGLSKPKIAFVEDMCCSAGYRLASECDEIVANNKFAQVGSIGVQLEFQDIRPKLEAEGYKFHTIRAPQSSEKNKIYDEIREGNYSNYENNVLKPLADDFIENIKQARPKVEESQLKGSVFFAHNVVGSLIDSIKSYDIAINDFAQNIITEKNENTINNKIEMKENINKMLGVDITPDANGNFSFSVEQMDKIENALKDSLSIQNVIIEKEKKIEAHVKKNSEKESEVESLKTTISELEKQAGDTSANAHQTTNGTPTADNTSSPYESVKEFFENLK